MYNNDMYSDGDSAALHPAGDGHVIYKNDRGKLADNLSKSLLAEKKNGFER